MAINNNDSDLKTVIVAALKKAEFAIPTFDKDNKAKDQDEWDKQSLIGSNKNIAFGSTPTKPSFQPAYSSSDETGLEKIAEVVAKEVLNYMVANAEVAMKDRMDTLEDNFNVTLVGLVALATALKAIPITAALGTALGTALDLAGGATRAADTATAKALETVSGQPVQIK